MITRIKCLKIRRTIWIQWHKNRTTELASITNPQAFWEAESSVTLKSPFLDSEESTCCLSILTHTEGNWKILWTYIRETFKFLKFFLRLFHSLCLFFLIIGSLLLGDWASSTNFFNFLTYFQSLHSKIILVLFIACLSFSLLSRFSFYHMLIIQPPTEHESLLLLLLC